MHMFCFQCQETSQRTGCTMGGTCGKDELTANYQDLLIFVLKGLGAVARELRRGGAPVDREAASFALRALYNTVTNTNFDTPRIAELVQAGLAHKRRLLGSERLDRSRLWAGALWDAQAEPELRAKAYQVGVLQTRDEDVRSLRETITYALKGIGAYGHHADELGFFDESLGGFVLDTLGRLADDLTIEQLLEAALATGRAAVTAMALLDRANRASFGEPQVTKFSIGVRDRPGILVTGHDLKDMAELLAQTEGTGVDVYTHSEMIAAQYYPAFRKYPHLAGNYGNSWWRQNDEFASFNGPILVTSNCIIPVAPEYERRIFTTGVAGYPGVPHLSRLRPDGTKDFAPIIALAKTCPPPKPIDAGELWGGFNHGQLVAHADKLIELVKAGRVSRAIVIGGCDGRELSREYYKELALGLPKDTLILTAGCAKYMFSKLPLGDIDGIPRVLDAGQCNDCYSLVAFALKLQEKLGLSDPNALPLSLNVAWYDQKAVAVLLALFHLGFKGMRLGPSLPAFFSPRVHATLVQRFGLKTIGSARDDILAMMQAA